MGILETITIPLQQQLSQRGTGAIVASGFAVFIVLAVILNVLNQLLLKNPNEPPVVFHWFPIIGSTITYGIDPYKFFFDCKAKYGDVFTFILLGKKTTVYLGRAGNDFILNGKLKDVNAEEIYTVLTTPVFGTDVVYDCPNSKLMEQKKFMKIGLTTEAFRAYVPIIADEVISFVKKSSSFKGQKGTVNIPSSMAEITIYTASHSLQGKEVRDRFDSSFASLYHDLDMGFSPINFMLHWAPLPHNRARDHAQRTVAKTYMEIIKHRRAGKEEEKHDIMWQLMSSSYKDGTKVPDKEIAHMMIALLMAGQHSSSSSSSWIMLRLASRPDIMEELYQEQIDVLGADLPDLTYEDLSRLPLHQAVLKETLRLHTPIHSIMRKVKSPMPISGTKYVIPTSHVLMSSPGCTSRDDAYFPNAMLWDPHRWDAGSGGVFGDDGPEEKEDYGYGLISKGASSPYLPFGAGRHRCIGEQFANVQLVTIMATMVDIFLSELERRLDFLENYGNLHFDAGISRAYATLQAVRARCSQVSGEVIGAGRRRARVMVETVESRYQDALVAKETLNEKVNTGIGLLEGILSDFEARAYKIREQGFVSAAGSLMDEGKRVVDGGLERARGVVDEGIERARKAAETLEEHIESAIARAREHGLIRYEDLPIPWRVNPYIKKGYRFKETKAGCIHSMFGISNELVNIWSHAIGLIIVLSIAFYFYPTSVAFSLSTQTDVFIAAVFFFAACKCLVCSTMWHTMNSVADQTLMERFACVDYTGISLLIAASIMTTEYTAFYCEPVSRWVYLTATATLGIGGVILPWHPTFNRQDMAWARVAFYVTLGATGFAPVMQLNTTRGGSWAWEFYAPITKSIAVYLLGAVVYASHVPERWYPGAFDYIGGSHNLWHFAVLGGILFHYVAMQEFFSGAFKRAENGCAAY